MGILLIICAVVMFFSGLFSPIRAFVYYPCALIALLAGIGLCLLKGRIKKLERLERRHFRKVMNTIDDLQDDLDALGIRTRRAEEAIEDIEDDMPNEDGKGKD